MKKRMNKKVALSLVYYYNPISCNGGLLSTFEALRQLQLRGVNVEAYIFVNYDPLPNYVPRAISQAAIAAEINHKILPYSKTEMGDQSQQHISKMVIDKIPDSRVDHIITIDNDFVSLFAAAILDIPGSHFFNALITIKNYVCNPFYMKLLKKRKIFTSSKFLQKCSKELLDLDAEIWYPNHGLSNVRITGSNKKGDVVGYYSYGKHKGDEIVNYITGRMPQVKFVIMGGDYSNRSGPLPDNVEYMGEVKDVRKFYKKVKIVIVPSIVEEAFSRIIIEAAINGIPAIGNKIGGIPEAMGQSGMLIEIDHDKKISPQYVGEQYIQAIEKLLNNADAYTKYREMALRRAKEYELEENGMAHYFTRNIS